MRDSNTIRGGFVLSVRYGHTLHFEDGKYLYLCRYEQYFIDLYYLFAKFQFIDVLQ